LGFSVKPKFHRQINLLVRTFCLVKRDEHIPPQPFRVYKNLYDAILNFRYISVVPILSPASLAFRPESADTPDALSENLHPSIAAELKRLRASAVSLFARSSISSRTHIAACVVDIAHVCIFRKTVTECSVSCRAILSGSVTLAA